MDAATLTRHVDEIRTLMADRLRVRGRTLDAQITRAGRLLPRRLASDGRYLAQAAGLAQNPKLARMIDDTRATQAHERLRVHLRAVDPAARRRDRLLGIAAAVAFNVLLTGAVVVTLLWWRGVV